MLEKQDDGKIVPVLIAECGHSFHHKCAQRVSKCPLCRTEWTSIHAAAPESPADEDETLSSLLDSLFEVNLSWATRMSLESTDVRRERHALRTRGGRHVASTRVETRGAWDPLGRPTSLVSSFDADTDSDGEAARMTVTSNASHEANMTGQPAATADALRPLPATLGAYYGGRMMLPPPPYMMPHPYFYSSVLNVNMEAGAGFAHPPASVMTRSAAERAPASQSSHAAAPAAATRRTPLEIRNPRTGEVSCMCLCHFCYQPLPWCIAQRYFYQKFNNALGVFVQVVLRGRSVVAPSP